MAKKKVRATVTDVAKSAGVSLGTVSRVLNNADDVNADIRARVWDAARTLNYSRLRQRRAPDEPNGTTASTGHIAVICFGMEDTLVQLPVVSAALQGIEGALSQQGHSLMFANIPRGDRVPPFLQQNGVTGVILKGPNSGELPAVADSPLLQHIYALPHVWLMGRLPNARGDHCNFDTEIAGRLVAEHLQARGHRRVAFMNPKPGQNQFERLKAAFFAAATRLSQTTTLLEVDPPERFTWPLPAITHQDHVDDLTEQWSKLPVRTRPTALFVPSDRTATQLYHALERRGLTVGKDLSVVSCNNEKSLVGNLHPGLTSVDVQAEFIGRQAVERLLWRIAHPGESTDTQLLVEPSLVQRDSVVQL